MYLIRGAFVCNNLKNYFTQVLFVLVFSQVYIDVRDFIFWFYNIYILPAY